MVTGAAGFLGEEITNYFFKKKYKVLAITNKKKIKFDKGIIHKKLNLKKKITFNFSPDVIIHCASKMPSRGHMGLGMYKENIQMMSSILNYAKIKKTKYIINMSSMSVYGLINRNFVFEKQKFIKPDLYGKSKYENEKLLKKFSEKNNSIGVSLRLPGVVGLKSHSNFISNVVNKIKKNEDIIVYNKFGNFNNILLASDVASFIELTLKKKFIKKKYFNFNIASKYPLKLKTVLEILIKMFKSDSKIIWKKSKKKSFLINFSKIKKFGYNPKTTKNLLLKLCNSHIKKN